MYISVTGSIHGSESQFLIRTNARLSWSNLLSMHWKHSPQDTEITETSELPEENRCVSPSSTKDADWSRWIHRSSSPVLPGNGRTEGTGIGLSYSKILVELHGGSIGAQDNEETGASFFFELPLRQEPKKSSASQKLIWNELDDDDNSRQPSSERDIRHHSHSFS